MVVDVRVVMDWAEEVMVEDMMVVAEENMEEEGVYMDVVRVEDMKEVD